MTSKALIKVFFFIFVDIHLEIKVVHAFGLLVQNNGVKYKFCGIVNLDV